MDKKYLSLTEAAELLQVDPEELKAMREQGEIRGFADRGTWKFRSVDVQDLVRSRQMDSDPEVPILGGGGSGASSLAPGESAVGLGADDAMASVLGDDDPGEDPTIIRGKNEDLSKSDSDVRLIVDDSISLADSDPDLSIVDGSDSDVSLAAHSDSDVRLPTGSGTLEGSGLLVGSVGDLDMGDADSDSDVQLVASDAEDDSDSDVQLMDSGVSGGKSDSDVRLSSHEIDVPEQLDSDSDVQLVDVAKSEPSADELVMPTDMDIDLGSASSDSDVVLPTSDGGSTSELALPDDDSGITLEFDDDDEDDSASVLLGADDSGITLDGGSGLLAGDSGISLEGPSDSGISLDIDDEGISLADDQTEFSLDAVGDSGISLEGDSGIALASDIESGVDLGGTASEFDSVDDDDIPETQFEIPAAGEDSEFDLDVDASDFEVEEADATAEFDLSDSFDDDTGEFDLDDSDMSDVSDFDSLDAASVADIDLIEGDDAFDDDSYGSEAGASYGAAGLARPSARVQQEWGTGPVVLSILTFVCMGLAAFMAFDLLGNIHSWDSQTPWTGFVIDSLSGMFS